MQHDVVWDGRDELTRWPMVDWIVFLHDEGFQPIWERRPMTSSMMWERMMLGRDGRDGEGSFRNTTPVLVNVDNLARMEAQWAKIKSLIPFAPKAPEPPKPVSSPRIIQRASSDEAVRELAFVEALRPSVEHTLCATTNKIKHASKLWALHHRNQLARLPDEIHPERLRAYKCQWCGGWHVGHKV